MGKETAVARCMLRAWSTNRESVPRGLKAWRSGRTWVVGASKTAGGDGALARMQVRARPGQDSAGAEGRDAWEKKPAQWGRAVSQRREMETKR